MRDDIAATIFIIAIISIVIFGITIANYQLDNSIKKEDIQDKKRLNHHEQKIE